MELRELTMPDPQPDELVVKVTYSGVSVGTERWALDDVRPDVKYPMVAGYLGTGVVEQVGSEVTGFAPGDHIMFTRSRLPEPYQSHWMGTHLSHALIKPGGPFVFKLPEDQQGPEAPLIGLGAVSYLGVGMMDVKLRDTALIAGQGMIGQTAAQFLRLRGARVMTTDVMPLRVRLSAEWSADEAVNVAEGDLAEAAREFASDGFDLVVDTSGSNNVVNQIYPLLRKCGQLLLQGWYPGDICFNFQRFHQFRPTVYVSCGMGDMHAVLDLLVRGKAHLAPLVTHVIPYQQSVAAYENLLGQGKEEFLGVVLDWREA
jgi:2-desacetyl-2-hydroxyethyl bacteriochlorophyllide A dehydrogenase